MCVCVLGGGWVNFAQKELFLISTEKIYINNIFPPICASQMMHISCPLYYHFEVLFKVVMLLFSLG